MNEQIKSPIEMLTDLLGEMTARALEAERQRDEALKSSDEWYQNWQRKDAQLKEVEEALKLEKENHERTSKELYEYIVMAKKGASENE